jgi:hypothetical protein
MPQTIITRPIGPSYIISATTASSTIAVRPVIAEPMNYAEFLSLSGNATSSVCVTLAPLRSATSAPSTPTLVFPNATSAATAPNSFMLRNNDSRVVPVPANGFSVSVVSLSTSTVFITPVSVM